MEGDVVLFKEQQTLKILEEQKVQKKQRNSWSEKRKSSWSQPCTFSDFINSTLRHTPAQTHTPTFSQMIHADAQSVLHTQEFSDSPYNINVHNRVSHG